MIELIPLAVGPDKFGYQTTQGLNLWLAFRDYDGAWLLYSNKTCFGREDAEDLQNFATAAEIEAVVPAFKGLALLISLPAGAA